MIRYLYLADCSFPQIYRLSIHIMSETTWHINTYLWWRHYYY